MKKLRSILFLLIIFHIITAPVCAEPVHIGMTFSPRQSEYLDQDWKKTYIQILDMNFDIIRLVAYWSQIENQKDRFDLLLMPDNDGKRFLGDILHSVFVRQRIGA